MFFKLSATDYAFQLILTDLMAIWQCASDKYDIIAEAARQHSSIDPSESDTQLKVLLSKLKQSLRKGNNRIAREVHNRSPQLTLNTTMDLPQPLRPLSWTFRLALQSASELAEQVLRPSLHEVSVSHKKIDFLQRTIKEKDHVISRLLERIGTSSLDMSLIFPGVTSLASRKGHVTVTEATKHVPGMAPFDDKAWIKHFASNDGYDGSDGIGLDNLVSGCEKCFVHSRDEHEDWISELPSFDLVQTGQGGIKSKPTKLPVSDDSTASEDDFEVCSARPSN